MPELHTYQCQRCKLMMTTTALSFGTGSPYRCEGIGCGAPMTYRWSEPIDTPARRELAARGIVFDPYSRRLPSSHRRCHTCHAHVEAAAMIRPATGGAYCSAVCARIGLEQQRAVEARVEQLYQRMPWLRPKESA